MPLVHRQPQQAPDAWRVFGHSFFMHSMGTRYQNGRADALVRAALDIEFPSWQNWATTGAKLNNEGYYNGGMARFYQGAPLANATTFTAPFVQYGGGSIVCYGINDVGSHTTQLQATFKHSLRTALSWLRGSTYYDVNHSAFTYSASWATTIGAVRDYTASTVGPRRTGTVGQTMTFTIPSTFTSNAISFHFVVNPGVNGGVLGLSGTATPSTKTLNGVVGATSITLSNFNTTGSLTHNNAVARVSGLSSANAGQTLVFTVSSLDAGGFIDFDGAAIEAMNPGPILLCNVSRLTASGYSIYPTLAGNSVSTNDALVNAYNVDIAAVAAEFDSMVQVVDIATTMDSSSGGRAEVYHADGLHPNEIGAALIADACLAAMQRLGPTARFGKTSQLNTPSSRWGTDLYPRRSGNWYTSRTGGGTAGTAYTLVAGDVWAIPFVELSPTSKWIQWCVEATAGSSTSTLGIVIYDDRGYVGYPQTAYVDLMGGALTSATPYTMSVGAGVKLGPTTGQGSLAQPADPGLYWLVLKVLTAGTGAALKTLKGPSPYLPNLSTTGLSTTGGYSGFKLTGQGTGALPTAFPAGAALSDNAPYIGLKYA